MRTFTSEQIAAIRVSSASLDWSNPITVSAEIVKVGAKYAIIWQSADGHDRVYGAVAGKWSATPLMAANRAEFVKNWLLKN